MATVTAPDSILAPPPTYARHKSVGVRPLWDQKHPDNQDWMHGAH